MGGLSKKSFLVSGLSADPNFPAVLINSGNMLVKKGGEENDLEAARISADGILQATRTMGGKVMGLGNLDLAVGIPFLQSYHQPPEFSLLSLNLVAPGATSPIFAPVARITAGRVRIAVLGLTDHTAVSGNAAVQVRPWQDCLEQTVAEVRDTADFVLLLSNYSLAENQEIARSITTIDCILQSGHVIGNMAPVVVKNTLIAQTDIRGKYLGMLEIEWNGHDRWHEAATLAGANGPISTYSNRFIALTQSMRNDPAVEILVNQVRQRLQQASQ